MGEPADKKGRATYRDILDAPEHKVAEIINGELRLSPRPAIPATSVNSQLGARLIVEFGSDGPPGGWVILFEPELHLGDDVLVPDIAGWRMERLPVLPDEAAFVLPPDWICEVLSPSTEKIDRAEKLTIYAAHGVQWAWLVHPRRRTLEAWRLLDGRWLSMGVFKDADRVRIEPFDAIEIDLAKLWARLPLPTRASELAEEYEYR
jgi:Uma2 family endonuclease